MSTGTFSPPFSHPWPETACNAQEVAKILLKVLKPRPRSWLCYLITVGLQVVCLACHMENCRSYLMGFLEVDERIPCRVL